MCDIYQELLHNLVRTTTAYVLQRTVERVRMHLEKARRKRRSCWVQPWLSRRYELGAYDTLMLELANEDLEGYVAFQRMAPDLFNELLFLVTPYIQKTETVMRKPISAGARLAITLRYLATGKYMCLTFA